MSADGSQRLVNGVEHMRGATGLIFATLIALAPLPAMAHSMPKAALSIGIEAGAPAQWVIQAIAAQGLDEKHNLDLDVHVLADDAAARAALAAGDVDLIAADFVWVSAQRSAGNKMTMVPDALATGGLIASSASDVTGLGDLKGATLAGAGGPSDTAWVILNADYAKTEGTPLADAVTANFGPATGINDLLANGGAQAGLNSWQWNAKATGTVDVLSLQAMLTDLGVSEQPAFSGWAFSDATAKDKKVGLGQFLDAVFEANATLLSDDAAWDAVKDAMGAPDDALFAKLRDGYRASIVSTYSPSATAPAKAAFKLIAQFGGVDLVGGKPALDAGTFWRGYRK